MKVRCACGWEAEGDEDQVVTATTEHGQQVHNMTPMREQILEMVVRED
jgi:predicted small metal-binding protein